MGSREVSLLPGRPWRSPVITHQPGLLSQHIRGHTAPHPRGAILRVMRCLAACPDALPTGCQWHTRHARTHTHTHTHTTRDHQERLQTLPDVPCETKSPLFCRMTPGVDCGLLQPARPVFSSPPQTWLTRQGANRTELTVEVFAQAELSWPPAPCPQRRLRDSALLPVGCLARLQGACSC